MTSHHCIPQNKHLFAAGHHPVTKRVSFTASSGTSGSNLSGSILGSAERPNQWTRFKGRFSPKKVCWKSGFKLMMCPPYKFQVSAKNFCGILNLEVATRGNKGRKPSFLPTKTSRVSRVIPFRCLAVSHSL